VGGATVAGELSSKVGSLRVSLASEAELPVDDAVRSYAFNSQLLVRETGAMLLLAPEESRANPRARAFHERVVASDNPVDTVEFVGLRQSMQNGGGPACLRLRIPMSEREAGSLGARVLFDSSLDAELADWISRHYRDRLVPADLRDPDLARES